MIIAEGSGALDAHDRQAGLAVAAALGLEPLESEGGLFRRVYTSASGAASCIHFLVMDGDFSAMHRLRSCDELFLFHAGAPLAMLLPGLDRLASRLLLGPNPLAGERQLVTVPTGEWQGAWTTGAWSLVSTVVTPAFNWADFELGDRQALQGLFPEHAERIFALTR